MKEGKIDYSKTQEDTSWYYNVVDGSWGLTIGTQEVGNPLKILQKTKKIIEKSGLAQYDYNTLQMQKEFV